MHELLDLIMIGELDIDKITMDELCLIEKLVHKATKSRVLH